MSGAHRARTFPARCARPSCVKQGRLGAEAARRLVAEARQRIAVAAAPGLPAMECQPFEHYDYLVLVFRHEQDFQRACELLGIKKVEVTYPGGLKKVGIGRVIDGAKAIDRLMAACKSGGEA